MPIHSHPFVPRVSDAKLTLPTPPEVRLISLRGFPSLSPPTPLQHIHFLESRSTNLDFFFFYRLSSSTAFPEFPPVLT